MKRLQLLGLLAATTLAAGAAAEEHFVTALPNNTFDPAVVNIQEGDTVTWSNGGGLHNVNAPGLFRCANGCDDMGGDGSPSQTAWSFSRTFDTPGTIDYQCDVHFALGMTGQVVVQAAAVPPALSITGDCPGQIALSITDATPSAQVLLLRGSGLGQFTVPFGTCAGTQLGITNPKMMAQLPINAGGSFSISPNAPAPLCGRPFQVFDTNDCEVSNVAFMPETDPGPPQIALQLVTGGIQDPVGVRNAGDGSNRLFIVSQRGNIRIFDGATLLPTPFLNIADRVDFGSEQGLLGLAFHPDYATNGQFYVNYTNNSGDTVISRFDVTGNPNVADPASEAIVLTIDQPFSNHNAGDLAFGPDGFLYIPTGDGGSGGDPQNNGQTLSTMLGKILRIDVDSGSPYAIPPDNPFVGSPGVLGEIWAYGLRNPWRVSFDRSTGDLFIGDVGQDSVEEVSFQSASSIGGENYGWRRMEGSECFNPGVGCNDGTLTLPILEYSHFGGPFVCSVIGGYRYRGSMYPSLNGIYLYADACSGIISGGMETGGIWESFDLLSTGLGPSSFGEDENGEIYLADLDGGDIYRITAVASSSRRRDSSVIDR